MTTPSPSPTSPSRAAARGVRLRRAGLAVGLALLGLAALVLVNVLATQLRTRVDVTAAGGQSLAPRTRALLDGLTGEYRLIIATDARQADPRARQNLDDVLADVTARQPRLRVDRIDIGGPTGARQFDTVIEQLAQRDAEPLARLRSELLSAQADTALAGQALRDDVGPKLSALAQALTAADVPPAARAFFEQAAPLLARRAGELSDASTQAQRALESSTAPLGVPPVEEVTDRLAPPLAQSVQDLTQVGAQLRALVAQSTTPAPVVQLAQPALGASEGLLARVTRAQQRLRGLPRPDVARVANALRAGSAAIMVGPAGKGVVALEVEQLLPTAIWLDAVRAARGDLQRRVEDTIATALASVVVERKPIVVLTHAEQRPFLDESVFFDALRSRLSLRGIDMLEWAVVTSPTPDFSRIDAQRTRPAVYVVLSPDASAARPVEGGLSGAERAQRLGAALGQLADQGAPILLSLAPSAASSWGGTDPLALVAEALGVQVWSGTPLLTREVTPALPRGVVQTDRVVQPGMRPSAGDAPQADPSPLASAVHGLPTYLTWALPMRRSQSAGDATVRPVLEVHADGATWGESQWLSFRQTPRERRAFMSQPPTPGDTGDQPSPPDGAAAWTTAMSVERAGRTTSGASNVGPPRRALVVGSNDWFLDAVTQQQLSVDGRAALAYPGNLELFESAIWWLSGNDQLIAQSAEARSVAMVRPIDAGALAGLRLALVLGLPGLVLVLGALVRVARG